MLGPGEPWGPEWSPLQLLPGSVLGCAPMWDCSATRSHPIAYASWPERQSENQAVNSPGSCQSPFVCLPARILKMHLRFLTFDFY